MNSKLTRFLTKAGWLLFYLYIVLLCYFLFFSEHYGRHGVLQDYKSNLVLFREIRRFIIYRDRVGIEGFIVNIFGNILGFAPFGFFLPLLCRRYRRFYIVAAFSLLFSLSIESIQLLFKVGIFDVDDLFLNTVGGMSGYLFYKIAAMLTRLIKAKRSRH